MALIEGHRCLSIIWEIKLVCHFVEVLVSDFPCVKYVGPNGFDKLNNNLFSSLGVFGMSCINHHCPVYQNASMVQLFPAQSLLSLDGVTEYWKDIWENVWIDCVSPYSHQP